MAFTTFGQTTQPAFSTDDYIDWSVQPQSEGGSGVEGNHIIGTVNTCSTNLGDHFTATAAILERMGPLGTVLDNGLRPFASNAWLVETGATVPNTIVFATPVQGLWTRLQTSWVFNGGGDQPQGWFGTATFYDASNAVLGTVTYPPSSYLFNNYYAIDQEDGFCNVIASPGSAIAQAIYLGGLSDSANIKKVVFEAAVIGPYPNWLSNVTCDGFEPPVGRSSHVIIGQVNVLSSSRSPQVFDDSVEFAASGTVFDLTGSGVVIDDALVLPATPALNAVEGGGLAINVPSAISPTGPWWGLDRFDVKRRDEETG